MAAVPVLCEILDGVQCVKCRDVESGPQELFVPLSLVTTDTVVGNELKKPVLFDICVASMGW
jgi:hypothetical protein